jgi:hypothetical protein
MWIAAWDDTLRRTKAAPNAEAQRMANRVMVFINFHTLTLRDGIPVEMAHRAFLAIDEYREHISPGGVAARLALNPAACCGHPASGN